MAEQPDIDAQWKEWHADPSPQASGRMLQSLDPTINSAIRVHVGNVNPVIKGKARAMTMQALQSYNPQRGKLSSHIYSHLQGLKRYSAQTAQGISIPERVSLDRTAMQRSEQELKDTLGRDPTEDELADHSGFSVKRIRHVRSFQPGMNEGMFAGRGETGETYDPAVNRRGGGTAWIDLVKSDMHPIDQKIIEYTQQNVSNQEIARKLRLSPGAVSQRKLKIQQTLDRETALSPF